MDLTDRRVPIDARRYTFGNDEFSLESAYHDCKLVFDGITDDDSFQEADTGLILYYANEIIYALHKALEGKDINVLSNDTIYRQVAIDAVIKRDANCGIDSAEVLKTVPSAQPEIIRCKNCKHYDGRPCGIVDWYNTADDFCSRAERRTDETTI